MIFARYRAGSLDHVTSRYPSIAAFVRAAPRHASLPPRRAKRSLASEPPPRVWSRHAARATAQPGASRPAPRRARCRILTRSLPRCTDSGRLSSRSRPALSAKESSSKSRRAHSTRTSLRVALRPSLKPAAGPIRSADVLLDRDEADRITRTLALGRRRRARSGRDGRWRGRRACSKTCRSSNAGFRSARQGLANVVEPDVFGWFLDWTDRCARRRAARRRSARSDYDPTTLAGHARKTLATSSKTCIRGSCLVLSGMRSGSTSRRTGSP